MLAFVERYLANTRQARADEDIVSILEEIAEELGFRSAYLVEYASEIKPAVHVLDTNPMRAGWWQRYVASGLRNEAAVKLLAREGVQRADVSRFTRPDDPMLTFAREVDMIDCTLVPISYDGLVVGLIGLCGDSALSDLQQTGLQLVAYNLFAQARSLRNSGITTARNVLTKREKEVMSLSSDGLTSQEIAERLGMSARTVNQHVDNVADKLGTKNRAHTVAEVIRHRLLD
jgi:LuxR family transcriptional regulator, quorum-sensing system regulator BjaR1